MQVSTYGSVAVIALRYGRAGAMKYYLIPPTFFEILPLHSISSLVCIPCLTFFSAIDFGNSPSQH